MNTCLCEVTGANLGIPICEKIFGYTAGLIFVPKLKADGTRNFIAAADITAGMLDTYVDGKINQADPKERWYFLQDIENINPERAESLYKEYESGNKEFIRRGIRKMDFLLKNIKSSPIFAGKLEQWRCTPFGVFQIDENGNIRGEEIKGDGNLYPILIDNGSLTVIGVDAKGNTNPETMVSMNVHMSVQDSRLRQLNAENMEADMLSKEGLIDVYATFSSIATTGFTMTLKTAYGEIGHNIPETGVIATDFKSTSPTATATLEGVDTPDVAITLTEAGETGVYAVAGTLVSGKTYNAVIQRDGYDHSSFAATAILIP